MALIHDNITYGKDISNQAQVIDSSDHAIYFQDGVVAGKTYQLSGIMDEPQYCRVAFYAANHGTVGAAMNPTGAWPFKFTAPTDAVKLYIVVMTNGHDTTATMSISEVAPGAKPLLTLGDSVTAQDLYQRVLRNAGIDLIVKGFPGSTVTRGFDYFIDPNYQRPSILDQALLLNPSDYSGVITLAGFNDSGYSKQILGRSDGVEIGDLTTGSGTYAGDYRLLLQHFADIPRFVLTPYKRTDDNWFFWKFNELTQGILFTENVPYFDSYSYSGIDKENASGYLRDAVHFDEPKKGWEVIGALALAGYNKHIKPHLS